jgi:hypothetical protein
MKNLFVMAVLTFSLGLVADDIICMGNSNTNQLIQIEVKLDKKLGTVELESQKYELSLSNNYMHVWQNTIDKQLYTNSLSRIDGSLTVIAEGVIVDERPQPVVRAILQCTAKDDLHF